MKKNFFLEMPISLSELVTDVFLKKSKNEKYFVTKAKK